MGFFRFLAGVTNESEHNLKKRFCKFGQLITGKDSTRDFLAKSGLKLTGRIFLITTWRTGKGEEDFKQVILRKNHKVIEILRVNALHHGESALLHIIRSNSEKLHSGDILAIVRGGGDTSDKSFSPFKSSAAAEAIERLKKTKGVIVVTGIGHASDHFLVEQAATFKQATPTDAANRICELLEV